MALETVIAERSSSRKAAVVRGRAGGPVGSQQAQRSRLWSARRDALGDGFGPSKVQRARPGFSQDCNPPTPVPWTTGKTPRLGRTLSSTSTGPLLVAIPSATARLLSARCETSRPSHAGCSPRVAASRTSRPSSGSDAVPGATRYSRSGKRSSRWSVSLFCACSLSSGPAPSDQPELLAVCAGRPGAARARGHKRRFSRQPARRSLGGLTRPVRAPIAPDRTEARSGEGNRVVGRGRHRSVGDWPR